MSPIVILSLLIPLAGTALGSAMVFFLRKEINPRLQKLLLGFASGVMIAASIWSLLQPAIDSFDKNDYKSWLIPAVAFAVGMGFMLLVLKILIVNLKLWLVMLIKNVNKGKELKAKYFTYDNAHIFQC